MTNSSRAQVHTASVLQPCLSRSRHRRETSKQTQTQSPPLAPSASTPTSVLHGPTSIDSSPSVEQQPRVASHRIASHIHIQSRHARAHTPPSTPALQSPQRQLQPGGSGCDGAARAADVAECVRGFCFSNWVGGRAFDRVGMVVGVLVRSLTWPVLFSFGVGGWCGGVGTVLVLVMSLGDGGGTGGWSWGRCFFFDFSDWIALGREQAEGKESAVRGWMGAGDGEVGCRLAWRGVSEALRACMRATKCASGSRYLTLRYITQNAFFALNP